MRLRFQIISVAAIVTRLGLFKKVLATIFLTKAVQVSDDIIGYFEKCHYQ